MTRITLGIQGLLLCIAAAVSASAAEPQTETLAATASIKSAGGASARAPLTVVIQRLATDAEREELMAAVTHGGTASARALLAKRADIGTVQLGERRTPIKYAFARPTANGKLVTVVTAEPIVYVGAGLPSAKPKEGYDMGIVMLEVADAGPGRGELVPATKVRVNDQGAIVTEDYSAEVIQLANVVRK